jgi:dipeptidyl aminopeptidase/acylaminoacyl peptidase
MLGSLSGAEPREIMRTVSHAEVAGPYLWFVREGTLWAQLFDHESAELQGEPIPVGEDAITSVWAAWAANGYFSVSATGVIAYHTGAPSSRSRLTWYDRRGRELATVGSDEYQYQLSLSPKAARAAVQIADLENLEWSLWTYDLERGTRSRFTFETAGTPIWSPDGQRLAFQKGEIYLKTLGREDTQPLRQGGYADYGREGITMTWPLDWSPDGRYLVYGSTEGEFENPDLWIVAIEGEGEPMPVQHSEFAEEDAAISPDGRWLAYTSDRSGQFEVYLTAFPRADRAWKVSSDGGLRPEWGVDSGELFYLDPDDTLMAATLKATGDSVSIEETQPLFRINVHHNVLLEPGGYAVAPGGERFLVNRVLEKGTTSPLVLVVGWPEGLEP